MGKHFTLEKRVQLEVLFKQGKSRCEMADFFGCSVRTIFYELKRGMVEQLNGSTWEMYQTYDAQTAQRTHNESQSAKGKPLKLGKSWDFVTYVQQKIVKEKYSPRAVLAEIEREHIDFGFTVSHSTLYAWIEKGYLGIKYSQLPEGKHKRRPVQQLKPNYAHALDKSIEKRPAEIAERCEFGHWEMDTVVGKRGGKKQVLLVLTERKTKMEIIRKMRSKSASETVRALNLLQKSCKQDFNQIFKTITVDNGTEFSDTEGIEKKGRTSVYYCHPYSSWERGQNENANRLIRRFVPKGTSIHLYTHKQIAYVQHWMNCYPRQALKWQRPIDLFNQELRNLNIFPKSAI